MTAKIAILANHLAGNGRALTLAAAIEDELLKRGVAFQSYKDPWPADFSGFSDIFLVGGDGTLHYFVSHYPGVKVPVTLFNGGTGNDVHWNLYRGKSMEEQIDLALTSEGKPFDVASCNGKRFANGIGIGFEGEVARALTGVAKRPGQTSFKLTVLKKIFSYRSAHYTITTEAGTVSGKKLLVDVCNGPRAGGGFHISPESVPDDGWLNLVTVDALSPLKRLRYLPVIEKGKHLGLPFVRHEKVKWVRIESEREMEFHLDGEYYAEKKLEITIEAGALRMKW